ncbi:MAG: T9SS type A sorting domain-containing protein [Prevotella sp.]|nr:T9SS type A sorting domain-containing protein [Prevotella sp.]
MKKILLFVLLMIGTCASYADDYTYPYLVFETADGTKTSVAVTDGTITIADGQLTMGGQTFSLSDLSKMYFSTTTTGIANVNVDDNSFVDVYDLNGRKVLSNSQFSILNSQLPKGIYIVKSGSKTYKIAVK